MVGALGASAVAFAPLGAGGAEDPAPAVVEVETVRLEPSESGVSAPLPGPFLIQESSPGATAYVEWVRSLDVHWSAENDGTRHVDPDMIGRLQGLSALRHFQLSATPLEPGGAGF